MPVPVLGAIAEVRVNVLMVAMLVMMRMGMDRDASGEQPREHRDAGEQEDGSCRDIETALPANGHRYTGEVREHSGAKQNHGVTSGEAEGEEGHAAKIVAHDSAEGSNGGQVIGAEAVENTRQKDGQEQHHRWR